MNSGDNVPKKPENRPGLPEIAYRISDYAGFRRRLLNLLPSILVPDESDKSKLLQPLAKLTTRLDDDAAIALLDAWAIVAEVLIFYQERIANEGYLRTATERRSILELARAIGYELKPGVAASTFLTFTVEDAPNSPKVAIIPKGTQIMSVPGKDELPQTFETSEEFTAHVDWNAIKPRSSRPQNITSDTRQLYLNGINTQLKAGEYLLLVDDDRELRTYLLSLTDVKEDAQAGYTLVKWEEYLNPPETPLRNPKVFAFRQKANLFGYNAPAWEDMTAEVKLAAIAEKGKLDLLQGGIFCTKDHGKKWNSVSKGLPNADILCLAIWDGVLFAGTAGKGIFRSKDNGNNWEPVNNGLTNLNIQTLYTNSENPRNPLFAGTPGGGVFRSKDGGETWVPINTGNVRVEGSNGTNWQSVNTSLPNTVVRAILTYTTENLAGTISSENTTVTGSNTVFKQELNVDDIIKVNLNSKIEEKKVTKITSDSSLEIESSFSTNLPPNTSYQIFQPKYIIFIGSDDGIYRSQNQGNDWISKNLTDRSVYCLLYKEKYFFAGTDKGLYRSSDRGQNWKLIQKLQNNSLSFDEKRAVFALVSSENVIFTGTDAGVFYSLDQGDSWDVVNAEQDNNNVTKSYNNCSLVTYKNGETYYLFAATEQGVFVSTYRLNKSESINNIQWTTVYENVTKGLSTQDITILAFNKNNKSLFAGSKFAGFLRSVVEPESKNGVNNGRNQPKEKQEWPDFNLQNNQIDLDTLYPQILPNSWIVLLDKGNLINQDNNQITFAVGQVKSTYTNTRKDFGLNAKITQIEPNRKVDNLAKFVLRSAIALIRSEELELAKELLTVSDRQQKIFQDPIQDKFILLKNYISELQTNQTLIVSGKRIRVQLDKISDLRNLQLVDDLVSKSVQRGDVLQLLELPASDRQWKLMDKDGFQGYLTTISSEEITLLPAAEDSEVVSEVVKIQSPPTDQQMPILTIQEPIKNAYDPATVKIYGNVVKATHGETSEEVLGSGDGNLTNQSFTLKKPPLTYVSTTTASGANSTLEVRVNGILWQEVPSLYPLTAQDQSYIIRIEDDGTTTVTFGDGIQGSRLPTGEENITATYRSGIGLDGNVGVDRLTLLKTRPLGIIEVNNPIPATGAAARESLEEVRIKGPATVRTLDRIVSLSDFEDFVRGFAGIGKAQAVELWHEETQLVHITIAAVNGAEVLRESTLYKNLIDAIDLARDPLQKVQIDSYKRLLFNLEARLLLDVRYQAEVVENKVRTAVLDTFAFKRRQFGQAVTRSEVVAVIQNIEGVVAVDLDALYQAQQSKTLTESLTVLKARSDPQKNEVHPAQLLLLDSTGIKLTTVSVL
ncbi:putative baseplate assembly protein [Aerosakkonemataceae cyanobacterium BLCC-F50]|uniref:Baseplate assembly protein n=1 Tax=Floridaenema flaviceps BLCC-F50 TaxID=3153642 RepID=A0ABV4XSZ3_9CYAN